MSRTAPRISPPPPSRGTPNTTGVHLHAQPAPQPRANGLHPLPNALAARAARREQQRVEQERLSAAATAYTCPELRRQPIPDGRYAAFALPSRMSERLHFPDGRVTDLHGQPLSPSPSSTL